MKKKSLLVMGTAMILAINLNSCSSDSNEVINGGSGVTQEDTNDTRGDINVLFFQSSKGFAETCEVFSPNCSTGSKELIVGEDGSSHNVSHLIFGSAIQKSSVFNLLHIDIETSQKTRIGDLTIGDTFDNNEIRIDANCIGDDSCKGRPDFAKKGQITVVDKTTIDSKTYITLSIKDVKFYSYKQNCDYTLNATIDYEILASENASDNDIDEALVRQMADTTPLFTEEDFGAVQQGYVETTNGTWIIRKEYGVLSHIMFCTEENPIPSPASPNTPEEFFNEFLPVTADNQMVFYDRDYRDDPHYFQFYKGIPVEESRWEFYFLDGIMLMAEGRFVPIDNLDVNPAVNWATAKKIASNFINESVDGENKHFYLSITSFPENGELKPRLVYVYKLWERLGETEYVFIDAQTGRILYHLRFWGASPYPNHPDRYIEK